MLSAIQASAFPLGFSWHLLTSQLLLLPTALILSVLQMHAHKQVSSPSGQSVSHPSCQHMSEKKVCTGA